jgi:hypothetical protein
VDPLDFPLGDNDNQPVVSVDPRASDGSGLLATDREAPSDGFYTPAFYRGAFRGENWAMQWTAMSRLDLFPSCHTGTGVGPVPDEVDELDAGKNGTSTTININWDEVQLTGMMGLQHYDVLRSTDPSNFLGGSTVCLATETTDTQAEDPAVPATGEVFYYVVRATNPCGDGPLGYQSNDVRTGKSCP